MSMWWCFLIRCWCYWGSGHVRPDTKGFWPSTSCAASGVKLHRGQKLNPGFSWWRSHFPRATGLTGRVGFGLNIVGVCVPTVLSWSWRLGEGLEGGMLSFEVPLWSLLLLLAADEGEKAFVALATEPKPGCWFHPGSLGPSCFWRYGLYRSWQTRVNWWLSSTMMSETLVLFCYFCIFFNLELFCVVFSLQRGCCVRVQQRMKIGSRCFGKTSRWIGLLRLQEESRGLPKPTCEKLLSVRVVGGAKKGFSKGLVFSVLSYFFSC